MIKTLLAWSEAILSSLNHCIPFLVWQPPASCLSRTGSWGHSTEGGKCVGGPDEQGVSPVDVDQWLVADGQVYQVYQLNNNPPLLPPCNIRIQLGQGERTDTGIDVCDRPETWLWKRQVDRPPAGKKTVNPSKIFWGGSISISDHLPAKCLISPTHLPPLSYHHNNRSANPAHWKAMNQVSYIFQFPQVDHMSAFSLCRGSQAIRRNKKWILTKGKITNSYWNTFLLKRNL